MRVAVREAPQSGAATAACVCALAEALGVAKTAVILEQGARSRRKRVRVDGEPARLEERIRVLASRRAS